MRKEEWRGQRGGGVHPSRAGYIENFQGERTAHGGEERGGEDRQTSEVNENSEKNDTGRSLVLVLVLVLNLNRKFDFRFPAIKLRCYMKPHMKPRH